MCNNDEQSVIHNLLFQNCKHRSSQVSCMFSVVHNSIQKITNILIKKSIILISILNKYLNIPIYLDNRTPLGCSTIFYITSSYIISFLWNQAGVRLVS